MLSLLEIITLIAICLIGIVLGVVMQRWLGSWRARSDGKHRYQRGHQLEEEAAALLEDSGYRILQHTPELTMILRVENRATPFPITPDFLVEKDGLQYIVEVKYWTGATSAINNAHIRRQIIEYLAASGLPCLLLEMPEGYVSLIDADLEIT